MTSVLALRWFSQSCPRNRDRGGERMGPWETQFTLLLPGRSYHARRPFVALDGLAHGRGLGVREMGVEDSGAARVASDHLPIWADLDQSGPNWANLC